MKLAVYLLGRRVATLESIGDFKTTLTYEADATANDFVSLTMPVRTESWSWDDSLHPIFRMNLPEGYLLHVLEERFGPHIGASPIKLLSVVGRNMVGRLQVAPLSSDLNEPLQPLDVADILQGDNSEEAFSKLVHQYATSGVSGVVPKFLDAEKSSIRLSHYNKSTLFTRRHIIKGSTKQLPYVSLNEFLCMQVAAKILPTAKTQISLDGQALVVDRFDVDDKGQAYDGLEDFCALLGLRPSAKYDTTWERIAKGVRDHVPGIRQRETFQHLATTILLTYALRNADCHAKNIALLYSSRADIHIAPIYDMVTTSVYTGYQDSPPGISFMGKKTWLPGKNLEKFLAATFGISSREQIAIVEKISDAMTETMPLVKEMMKEYSKFRELGKRMLSAWSEGRENLRSQRMYTLGSLVSQKALKEFSPAPKLRQPKRIVGKE
ncbi:MAG: type II toxin-antitoxin system HipA family toxin [Verrucomicrobiae bacterium]|nr:type II toxin-antitoxin system HipA family toxin [Verrucomicrobiae bacterium]